ncbi:MAG: acetylhydrolase, partial [Planctomycetota bacterium]
MAAYNPGPGEYQVKQHLFDWRDADRRRDVPVLIYRPDGQDEPWPVVLFSHGVGSSRAGYRYLGRHWASHGYVAVHVTHVGSDDSAAAAARGQTRRWMDELMQDVDHRRERPRDLSFVLDCLA